MNIDFDENGYIQPAGENGSLFTSYLLHIVPYNKIVRVNAEKAIEAALVDYNDYLSHDNVTGIVCASKLLGLDYHKNLFLRDWWRRAHPRDIGFYLFMKFNLKIFLVPTIISMLYACWHKQITMGNLDTDGKILSWLRLKHMNMPWVEELCLAILVERHNLTSWSEVFEIYFGENHIIPVLLEDRAE
jgi:hypothetical protein